MGIARAFKVCECSPPMIDGFELNDTILFVEVHIKDCDATNAVSRLMKVLKCLTNSKLNVSTVSLFEYCAVPWLINLQS